MKIIQTPVRFYPAIGGVEKYVLDLSSELVKQGIDVKVICANDPKSDLKEYKGIKIDRLNYCCKIANTNLSLFFPFKLWKENFDIVHTHLPTPWFVDWSIIIAKLKRKKSVLTYHNDIIGRGISLVTAKLYNATFLKLTLFLADKIIITQPKYLEYSLYLKQYKNKIEVIPNGVDLDRFRRLPNIKKEKNTLFFLSVLNEYHKYKGLDYLLEAMKLVKKEIPEIRLIVGGKGKLLNYYKNKTKELDVEKNVEFHGFIPEEKLVEYYNRYEVFVLPSIDSAQEGFGIVLLEALACGMPVITTDIVGIANDNGLEKRNIGFVVTPRNSQKLAEGIIKFFSSTKLIKSTSFNTQTFIKKYDLKNNYSRILNLYQKLI
jgi:glycosyltransferase involved in cell wall biosynthesis